MSLILCYQCVFCAKYDHSIGQCSLSLFILFTSQPVNKILDCTKPPLSVDITQCTEHNNLFIVDTYIPYNEVKAPKGNVE